MKVEEKIEKLRYKANNIKAKIEPEFFNEVADRLEKQTWISIDDRLPEDNTRVLVYCEWECEHIALRRNNVWVGEVEVYNDDDVLAWMPLPEPYKWEGATDENKEDN